MKFTMDFSSSWVSFYCGHGCLWMRRGREGAGFSIINHRVSPPLFSEREGFRQYRHLGPFCLRRLEAVKPKGIGISQIERRHPAMLIRIRGDRITMQTDAAAQEVALRRSLRERIRERRARRRITGEDLARRTQKLFGWRLVLFWLVAVALAWGCVLVVLVGVVRIIVDVVAILAGGGAS